MAKHAGQLAWQDGLRGYDAMHLATALWWQANLEQDLVVATYDREFVVGSQAAWAECVP